LISTFYPCQSHILGHQFASKETKIQFQLHISIGYKIKTSIIVKASNHNRIIKFGSNSRANKEKKRIPPYIRRKAEGKEKVMDKLLRKDTHVSLLIKIRKGDRGISTEGVRRIMFLQDRQNQSEN